MTEDKPYEALGFAANWTVSIAGETVAVNQIGKQEGTTLIYGVSCLRNLVWPGAVTVGYRGGWTNIYVGYGHRLSLQYNAIREIKEVQVEAEDKNEKPEPNPSKPPVVVVEEKYFCFHIEFLMLLPLIDAIECCYISFIIILLCC